MWTATQPGYCLRHRPITASTLNLLEERNIATLLALYAKDATLVPTSSDEVRGTESERRAYFESFLANGRLTCGITVQKKRVSHLLGTVVIDGLYAVTMERNEALEKVAVRFLFTFEKVDGQWLITGHSSSKSFEDL